MKTTRLLSALLALAIATVARPAEPEKKSEDQRRNDAVATEMSRRREARDAVPTLTVDFPGGTINQLVAQLSQLGGRTLNVIGDKNDFGTELPPFSLRNVDPAALAAALNVFLNSRGLQLMPASGHDNAVYVLKKSLSVPPTGPETMTFDSFQLGPYLEAQSIDDITGAIRAAWELNPAHKPAALQLKYHPATSILLASGSHEALDVVRHVISVLKRPEPKAKSPPPAAEKR